MAPITMMVMIITIMTMMIRNQGGVQWEWCEAKMIGWLQEERVAACQNRPFLMMMMMIDDDDDEENGGGLGCQNRIRY